MFDHYLKQSRIEFGTDVYTHLYYPMHTGGRVVIIARLRETGSIYEKDGNLVAHQRILCDKGLRRDQRRQNRHISPVICLLTNANAVLIMHLHARQRRPSRLPSPPRPPPSVTTRPPSRCSLGRW